MQSDPNRTVPPTDSDDVPPVPRFLQPAEEPAPPRFEPAPAPEVEAAPVTAVIIDESPGSVVDDSVPTDPTYVALTLSVGSGFKFGCGLILAGIFGLACLILLLSIALFALSLAGVPLPVVTP